MLRILFKRLFFVAIYLLPITYTQATIWVAPVYFGQGQRQDTLATHEIKRYLDDNGPESSWGNSGLRVCFVPRTHYSSFIMVLNLLYRFHIQQYFLDIRNEPVALYALTVPKSKCPPMPK